MLHLGLVRMSDYEWCGGLEFLQAVIDGIGAAGGELTGKVVAEA